MGSADQLSRPASRGRDDAGITPGAIAVVLIASLARAALLLVACLAVWAILPTAIGWQPTVVMSGSMQPAVMTGDIAVTRPLPTGDLAVGQIVLVADPDHPDRLRLHRIAEIRPGDDLVLRGDANLANDSSLVAMSDVIGVLVLRIPAIGLPGVLLADGDGLALLLLGVAAGGAALLAILDRPLRAPSRRAIAAGFAAGALAAVVVFGAPQAAPTASAAFATSTGNTPSSFAANPFYTCSEAILGATPWIYLKFDETSGTTAADASGNGRTGTYRGAVTLGSASACPRDTGRAVNLGGTTGFVSTNTSVTAPTTYSVSIWFRSTSTAGGRLVGFGNQATARSTTDDRHLYLHPDGKVVFGILPGRVTLSTTSSYNDGAWHHAVGTRSASGMTLYVDGVLQASNTVTTAQSYTGRWRVGWDNLQGWPGFPGATNVYTAATVDNMAVFTTALTATQVAQLYAAGR